MQRLSIDAVYDGHSMALYQQTVRIIQNHLSPSVAALFAEIRQNGQQQTEWWTAREGEVVRFDRLSLSSQQHILQKREGYLQVIAELKDLLASRGEQAAVQLLQQLLLTVSQATTYSVGNEPVLTHWCQEQKIVERVAPSLHKVSARPPKRWPWLVAALLLLLLFALGLYFFLYLSIPKATLFSAAPLPKATVSTVATELTYQRPNMDFTPQKDFGRISVNLTWENGQHTKPLDLDIAAFVRFKNGDKSGVEALSHMFGNYDRAPYVVLQKDLRNGDQSNNGEWLFINGSHWQEIDEVLIYSFIYSGSHTWQGTDAKITLSIPGQAPIITRITDDSGQDNVAVIARIKNNLNSIQVQRVNRFFPSRQAIDDYYRWGFKWHSGATKN